MICCGKNLFVGIWEAALKSRASLVCEGGFLDNKFSKRIAYFTNKFTSNTVRIALPSKKTDQNLISPNYDNENCLKNLNSARDYYK